MSLPAGATTVPSSLPSVKSLGSWTEKSMPDDVSNIETYDMNPNGLKPGSAGLASQFGNRTATPAGYQEQ